MNRPQRAERARQKVMVSPPEVEGADRVGHVAEQSTTLGGIQVLWRERKPDAAAGAPRR